MNLFRRQFIKYLLIVSLSFLAGIFFDSIFKIFSFPSSKVSLENKSEDNEGTEFSDLRKEETEKEIRFYDKDGNEILIIEK